MNYGGFLNNNNRNLSSLFETVDEMMTEEDQQSVVSASLQSMRSSGNVFQAIHISALRMNEISSGAGSHERTFSFNNNAHHSLNLNNHISYNQPEFMNNHSSSNTYLQVTPHLNGKASLLSSNMSRTSSSAASNEFNNSQHFNHSSGGGGGF